ncbi:MAG: hypothetical protein ACK415_13215, partial [Thermodesulfovibrionales bacterium]
MFESIPVISCVSSQISIPGDTIIFPSIMNVPADPPNSRATMFLSFIFLIVSRKVLMFTYEFLSSFLVGSRVPPT